MLFWVLLPFLMTVASGVSPLNCQSPRVSVNRNYATREGSILTSHAYVAKLALICNEGKSYIGTVYFKLADDPDIRAVASVENDNYQVSWKSGPYAPPAVYKIDLYDEQGMSQLRKTPEATVRPLSSFEIVHPGSFYEPWVPCEVLAVITAFSLVAHAVATRAKLG